MKKEDERHERKSFLTIFNLLILQSNIFESNSFQIHQKKTEKIVSQLNPPHQKE